MGSLTNQRLQRVVLGHFAERISKPSDTVCKVELRLERASASAKSPPVGPNLNAKSSRKMRSEGAAGKSRLWQ